MLRSPTLQMKSTSFSKELPNSDTPIENTPKTNILQNQEEEPNSNRLDRSRDSALQTELNRLQRFIKKVVPDAENSYFNDYIAEAETIPRKFWKVMRSLPNKKLQTNRPESEGTIGCTYSESTLL